MSNILKRPGWASRDVLSEKVKIGDVEKVIPGWGPGKPAKSFFAGKIGEEVPTGRYGAMRKVAGTSYREAELAFARYCAASLEIAENVIATKEVKHILRELTAEKLLEKGYESVEDWLQGWVEYAQDTFGMDLANVQAGVVRRARERDEPGEEENIQDEAEDAINDVAQEIEEQQPEGGEMQELPEEIQRRIINNDIKPQGATPSEDQRTFASVTFMGQEGDKLTYIRLKDVPKDAQHRVALKAVKKVGDIINNDMLAQYVSEIELERNNSFEKYKLGQAAAPNPQAPEAPEDRAPRPIELDLEAASTKLNSKQQTILAEQMRIARKQHLQRIEERYRFY